MKNSVGLVIHLALVLILAVPIAPWSEVRAEAEILPLWEVGFGAGAFNVPDYPGADESSTRSIALPYVIYRGDFFRVGDGGARGVFVDNDRFEVDLSFSAAFDASSSDNAARQGMPDIDFLGEIGPNLKVKLANWQHERLVLDLPVRGVFSTDFSSVEQQGYKFNPRLTYANSRFLNTPTQFALAFSSAFATEEVHDYFYAVDQPFVNPDRPFYDAGGGYLGSTINFAFSNVVMKNMRITYGGQIRYFGGAENRDSPLHRDDFNYTIGAGIIWSFWQSETKSKPSYR